jgi:hypothetical protein
MIRKITAELQHLSKTHGPLVQFVKLSLEDGRTVTIWADGRCTFLPATGDSVAGPRHSAH